MNTFCREFELLLLSNVATSLEKGGALSRPLFNEFDYLFISKSLKIYGDYLDEFLASLILMYYSWPLSYLPRLWNLIPFLFIGLVFIEVK